MTESKMLELLEKLEKHDPETHLRYHNVLVRFGLTIVSPGLPFAWLQYVIQDAIKSKGLGWTYIIHYDIKGSISVLVNHAGTYYRGEGLSSEAEAILFAYVAALGAEAGK